MKDSKDISSYMDLLGSEAKSASAPKYSMPRMVGVFGGTFDPVHFGHTKTISELSSLISFKKVIIIPSAKPPHKQKVTASFEQRVTMTRLAFKNQKGVFIDGREALRPGPSYAIDTVKDLLAKEKRSKIVLIMGSDAFAKIDTWHRWEDLLALVDFIVIKRPNPTNLWKRRSFRLIKRENDLEDFIHSKSIGRVFEVKLKPIRISSSKVRKDLALGKNVERLVGSKVKEYVLFHKLYGSKDFTK